MIAVFITEMVIQFKHVIIIIIIIIIIVVIIIIIIIIITIQKIMATQETSLFSRDEGDSSSQSKGTAHGETFAIGLSRGSS